MCACVCIYIDFKFSGYRYLHRRLSKWTQSEKLRVHHKGTEVILNPEGLNFFSVRLFKVYIRCFKRNWSGISVNTAMRPYHVMIEGFEIMLYLI